MEEENGKTIGDIFRIAFTKKWIALIVALAITVVGTLALYFGYSKRKAMYSVTFRAILPIGGSEEGGYRYPDGALYNYQALISKDNLSAVKEDTGIDIDVDKIIKNGGISIEKVKDKEEKELGGFIYKVSANQTYFQNRETAITYLQGIANSPYEYLSEMKLSFNSKLKLYEESKDYEKRVDYLSSQLSTVLGEYQSLASSYGSNFIITGTGESLQDYINYVNAYISNPEYSNLRIELREGKYLMDDSIITEYNFEITELNKDLKSAETVLAVMQQGVSDLLSNAEAIRAQAERIENIKQRIQVLTDYIEAHNVDTEGVFAARIKKVYDRVAQFTEELNEMVTKIYKSASGVYVLDVGGISAEGGIGLILCALISLVLGCIIALIVAYIVGNAALNKKTAKKEIEATPLKTE